MTMKDGFVAAMVAGVVAHADVLLFFAGLVRYLGRSKCFLTS